VPFPDIFWKYNAPLFQDALANFIADVNNSGLRVHALHTRAGNTLLPFRSVCVYHNMKFIAINDAQKWEIVDAIYVQPEQKDKQGRIIPAQFDTVLVQGSEQSKSLLYLH